MKKCHITHIHATGEHSCTSCGICWEEGEDRPICPSKRTGQMTIDAIRAGLAHVKPYEARTSCRSCGADLVGDTCPNATGSAVDCNWPEPVRGQL